MKVELYIPYYPERAAGSGNDMSDKEYANRLLDMFNGEYHNFMNKALADASDERYEMRDIMPEKYAIEAVEDQTTVQYYGFECVLNDENDANMSADEFLYYYNSGDMCAFFVHLIISDEYRNTDAINELNFWLRESRAVVNDPHIDEDHKFSMLPDKDIIVKVPGLDNIIIKNQYKLSGSRVVDQDNNNNFAIIVTKIEVVE